MNYKEEPLQWIKSAAVLLLDRLDRVYVGGYSAYPVTPWL
jgi:hypothetical protein